MRRRTSSSCLACHQLLPIKIIVDIHCHQENVATLTLTLWSDANRTCCKSNVEQQGSAASAVPSTNLHSYARPYLSAPAAKRTSQHVLANASQNIAWPGGGSVQLLGFRVAHQQPAARLQRKGRPPPRPPPAGRPPAGLRRPRTPTAPSSPPARPPGRHQTRQTDVQGSVRYQNC